MCNCKSIGLMLIAGLAIQNYICAQAADNKIPLLPKKPSANVISVSLLPVTALEGATYFGASIEYKRFLGKRGPFSVNAPLFGGKIGLQKEIGQLYTFAPGFCYHPTGNARKLDFSFGPQLLLGREKHQDFELEPTEWNNITGLLLQMNLDLHFKPHGLVGLYTAWGFYNDGNPCDCQGLAVLLGLKIGTRF